MRNQKSIVVTAEQLKAANAAMQKQGYGPYTFSVEMIPTTETKESASATHYGCSWAMTDADVAVVQNTLANVVGDLKVQSQRDKTFDESISADGQKRRQTIRDIKSDVIADDAGVKK